jgi:beta-xylosidase
MLLVVFFSVKNTGAEGTYSNPVLIEVVSLKNSDSSLFSGPLGIGDPSVIFHENKYYLYPTGDNSGYDVYLSTDLVRWNKGPRVFQAPESGAWAPDVFYNPADRKFYLYYTVNRRIGVAVADRPDGTFAGRETLVKGAIDAHMFLDDDGEYYLYYVTYPAFRIYVQPMKSPVRRKGKPVPVIQPDEAWEKKHAPITEAPWMLKHRVTYYLLYSGGSADSQHYAIGYATAESPVGPFTKHAGNPIVKKGNGVYGPGHGSVARDRGGTLWMVYHQQKDETRGWNRIICIDPLRFDEKGVLHGRATRGTLHTAPVAAGP